MDQYRSLWKGLTAAKLWSPFLSTHTFAFPPCVGQHDAITRSQAKAGAMLLGSQNCELNKSLSLLNYPEQVSFCSTENQLTYILKEQISQPQIREVTALRHSGPCH